MAQLFVTMYAPSGGGNYEHWALYLKTGSTHTIYEVIGEHPGFQKHIKAANPINSSRHKRSIFVAYLNPSDLSILRRVVDTTPPDNSTVEWNCQDYVIEILEKLEMEEVIDNTDTDYIDAKGEVMEYFGPV